MDALLKRYFWIVNLVAIAVMAWLVATGINGYLAAQLFAVPSAQAGTPGGDGADGKPTLGRVKGPDVASALDERRVFMLDLPEPEEPPDDGGEVPPVEEKPEPPSGELEESTLPIDLMGTMVAGDVATSIATLSIEGETKLAWVGSEVMDGKAKVLSIAPRHVVIDESGARKIIRLWTERQAQATAPGGRPIPGRPGAAPTPPRGRPPTPAPTTSQSDKPDYAKGVKKTGAYDYEIDRSMLDQQLQDLSSLGREARIVPNYRGGKYEGFKLVGVRPGSLYRTIGIRSGDVIKSINGRPIDSPNKAIELFEKLKSSASISLEVERRGQTKQLNYNIK